MSKKYVLETACLHCTYGSQDSTLRPYSTRHVYAEKKLMGNMVDFRPFNNIYPVLFGVCNSPFLVPLSADFNAETLASMGVKGIQDFNLAKVLGAPVPCDLSIISPIQWQDVKEDVLIGHYPALLEDSWTICMGGYGVISLIDSGQSGDNPLEAMQARISELTAAVDAYMSENGIDPSMRDELLESMLLWNGYSDEDTKWDKTNSKEARDFCDYLQRNNKSLFNYFERGLYADDGSNGKIDFTYMMGISKANKNNKNGKMGLMSPGLAKDEGMLNGYAAAMEQEPGKSCVDSVNAYIDKMRSSDYDNKSKYNALVAEGDLLKENPSYENSMRMNGYDPANMSTREKNQYIQANQAKNAMDSDNLRTSNYNPTTPGGWNQSYLNDENKSAADAIMQSIYDKSESGK